MDKTTEQKVRQAAYDRVPNHSDGIEQVRPYTAFIEGAEYGYQLSQETIAGLQSKLEQYKTGVPIISGNYKEQIETLKAQCTAQKLELEELRRENEKMKTALKNAKEFILGVDDDGEGKEDWNILSEIESILKESK